MPDAPASICLPTLIKNFGFFPVIITSDLPTVPAAAINLLAVSVAVAHSADKRGNYTYHALVGVFLVYCWFPCSRILKR